MTPALQPYAQILSHALNQRRNEWGRTGPRLLLGAVVGFLVLGRFAGGASSLGAIVGIALLFTIGGVFGMLVSSLLTQNRPLMARLVPGHAVQLRQALWGVWLVSSALLTGVAMSLGHAAAPSAELALWGLGFVAVLLRWPLFWSVAWVLPTLLWSARKLPGFADLWAWQRAHQSLALLISLLVLGFWLSLLLGEGDERHARAYQRGRRWRVGTQSMGWQGLPRPLCGLNALFQAPYRWHLARLCAQPVPRTLTGRLMLGLGPNTHWSGQVSLALTFFSFCLVGILTSLALTHLSLSALLRSGGFGLGIGLVNALLARLWSLGQMLNKTRGEQRLLMLLPGVPRGRALNRVLAWRWLLQFGLSWCLGIALIALEMAKIDSGETLPLMMFIMLAYLMPLALIWRDWARWKGSDGGNTMLSLVGLAGSMGLALIATVYLHLPVGVVATVQIAVPLAIGVARWRQQLNAPQAFPVSRLV